MFLGLLNKNGDKQWIYEKLQNYSYFFPYVRLSECIACLKCSTPIANVKRRLHSLNGVNLYIMVYKKPLIIICLIKRNIKHTDQIAWDIFYRIGILLIAQL